MGRKGARGVLLLLTDKGVEGIGEWGRNGRKGVHGDCEDCLLAVGEG